jgi:hypothetical protein
LVARFLEKDQSGIEIPEHSFSVLGGTIKLSDVLFVPHLDFKSKINNF